MASARPAIHVSSPATIRVASGSAENMDDDKNHDVVCKGHQVEVAASAVFVSAADVEALTAFDHRHHGFDLAAVVIGVSISANLHESSIAPGRRLRGRTAVL